MKKGDWVTHTEYGWLGRIQKVHQVIQFTNLGNINEEESLYKIKWCGVKKRYGTILYEAHSLTPYQPPTKSDNALSTWLASPDEKLRNALAAQKERRQLASATKRPARMDGR